MIEESDQFKDYVNMFDKKFLAINNKCSSYDGIKTTEFRENFAKFLSKEKFYSSQEMEKSIKLYKERKRNLVNENKRIKLLKQQLESHTLLFQRSNREKVCEIKEKEAIDSN